MNLTQIAFFLHQYWQGKHLKKTKVKLDLQTDTNMLLMVEKDISGGICHAKSNNKYIKN